MEFFECKHCDKILKSEKAFINHYCEEMKRHELLYSTKGQLGFEIYSRWMYILKSSKVDREQFKRSKHFNACIKFAKYYNKIGGLSDLDEFLLFMVKRQFYPYQWLDSRVISFYLSAMECIDPKGKIERTVEFILKITDKFECSTSSFFNYMDAQILSDCIKMHKLSPWILLNSKKFIKWFKNCDALDQNYILEFMDVDKWVEIFNNDHVHTSLAKKYCKALGI